MHNLKLSLLSKEHLDLEVTTYWLFYVDNFPLSDPPPSFRSNVNPIGPKQEVEEAHGRAVVPYGLGVSGRGVTGAQTGQER